MTELDLDGQALAIADETMGPVWGKPDNQFSSHMFYINNIYFSFIDTKCDTKFVKCHTV